MKLKMTVAKVDEEVSNPAKEKIIALEIKASWTSVSSLSSSGLESSLPLLISSRRRSIISFLLAPDFL